jgi:hypothetical protein
MRAGSVGKSSIPVTTPLSLVLVSLSGRASDRCCRTPSVVGSTLCSPGAARLRMPILVRVSLETPRTPCGSDRPRRDSRQHNRITLGGCLNRLLQQNRHETDQQRCPQLGRYRGKADMAQVALFGRRMNSKRKMASAHACYWQGNNVRA